jgi:hypothetical protein
VVRAGRAYCTGSVVGGLIPRAGRTCYGPRPLLGFGRRNKFTARRPFANPGPARIVQPFRSALGAADCALLPDSLFEASAASERYGCGAILLLHRQGAITCCERLCRLSRARPRPNSAGSAIVERRRRSVGTSAVIREATRTVAVLLGLAQEQPEHL